jgi:hypothetical protein
LRKPILALAALIIPFAAFNISRPQPAASPPPHMVVYKSPTCGCCTKWVEYMRSNGFTVEVHDQDDLTAIKRAAGVPDAAISCHTAQVGGYVIEGHVPVEAIRKLLAEKPAIAGLAVPGMVMGSPGMEQGNAHPAYDVMAIGRDGKLSVYARR